MEPVIRTSMNRWTSRLIDENRQIFDLIVVT